MDYILCLLLLAIPSVPRVEPPTEMTSEIDGTWIGRTPRWDETSVITIETKNGVTRSLWRIPGFSRLEGVWDTDGKGSWTETYNGSINYCFRWRWKLKDGKLYGYDRCGYDPWILERGAR